MGQQCAIINSVLMIETLLEELYWLILMKEAFFEQRMGSDCFVSNVVFEKMFSE